MYPLPGHLLAAASFCVVPTLVKVQLLDRLGLPSEEIEVPLPLPLVIWRDGETYLRLMVKGTRYRWVTSFISEATAASGFGACDEPDPPKAA